jgi:hypothetical protein
MVNYLFFSIEALVFNKPYHTGLMLLVECAFINEVYICVYYVNHLLYSFIIEYYFFTVETISYELFPIRQ